MEGLPGEEIENHGRMAQKNAGKEGRTDAPAGGDADAVELLSGLDDDSVPVGDITVKSSPKETCRYIFRQLMAGTSRPALRADLLKRRFSAKVADMYVELVYATMIKK